MITTVQDINLNELLEPLNLNLDDEIDIKTEQGKIIITKVNYIPNEETLKAMEEVKEMEKNPHLYKSYSNVDEMIKDILK